ncbi:hypothetical protein [Nonomuraea dietziae]|uniref:hypothetical protein n=1 Tax=Nonomuraea dietziae TaxID=65515 RepID=UPI0031DD8F1F
MSEPMYFVLTARVPRRSAARPRDPQGGSASCRRAGSRPTVGTLYAILERLAARGVLARRPLRRQSTAGSAATSGSPTKRTAIVRSEARRMNEAAALVLNREALA